jgi:hypothetical protein
VKGFEPAQLTDEDIKHKPEKRRYKKVVYELSLFLI